MELLMLGVIICGVALLAWMVVDATRDHAFCAPREFSSTAE